MKPKKNHKKKSPKPYQKNNYESSRYLLHGIHAVISALKNKKRTILKLYLLQSTLDRISNEIVPYCKERNIKPIILDNLSFDKLICPSLNHQGIALETKPLNQPTIEDLSKLICNNKNNNIIIILDQINDPHNLGAILRTAAAFNVLSVIIPKDNSVCESATTVKISCGASETIPLITVTNLSKTITDLKELNFWCIGLDGYADSYLNESNLSGNIALIMGSEGKGLRRLTKKNCDIVAKLPIHPQMESLNVSNATSISLYEVHRQNNFKALVKLPKE